MEAGTISEYLKKAWIGLNLLIPNVNVRHICRRHLQVIEFLNKQILQKFQNRPVSIKIMKTWIHEFLQGKDLWSFTRRVGKIALICGSPEYTPKVQHSINNLGGSTNKKGTLS